MLNHPIIRLCNVCLFIKHKISPEAETYRNVMNWSKNHIKSDEWAIRNKNIEIAKAESSFLIIPNFLYSNITNKSLKISDDDCGIWANDKISNLISQSSNYIFAKFLRNHVNMFLEYYNLMFLDSMLHLASFDFSELEIDYEEANKDIKVMIIRCSFRIYIFSRSKNKIYSRKH